jgi:6-phosphofructokinase 1
VGKHIGESDAFVFFSGINFGETQVEEALAAINRKSLLKKKRVAYNLFLVELPGACTLPPELSLWDAPVPLAVAVQDEACARLVAKAITESLVEVWYPDDDLPIGYPFDYEKTIIKEYSKGELSSEKIAQGCPREWPKVAKNRGSIQNKISTSEIGLYRDWDNDKKRQRREDPQVVVAALTDYHTDDLVSKKLTLPEAGPRKYLYYPNSAGGDFTVGVMVSGGIAPGINAVIAGIAERQTLYAERGKYRKRLKIRGYHNGLSSLFRTGTHYSLLTPEAARSQANLGGSMLGTSRAPEFMSGEPVLIEKSLTDAVTRLAGHGTQILYIIGGDGSMRAAHALWKKAKDMNVKLSVVGIPKTMDNDILWVWQSFGFLSAVEWSKECIQQLYTEAKSNPRLGVIQLFGSDSGFVVTHAVMASGDCDLFLIPEAPFTMKRISSYIKSRLKDKYEDNNESSHGLIVMAETAIPHDAADYINESYINLTDDEKREILSFLGDKGKRVFGQTPDPLRSGGLKLVSRVLEKNIRLMADHYWHDYRVFTNEPRHLIRSIPPSSSDIIFGHRLGSLAVDCAMAGYNDFMISQWLTEYVMVPLRLVTLGRKRIPQDGIFYKSARASTGQPADLM